MDISYHDVYKDKLNYIACRTEKIRNALDEEYGTHFPGDYDDIKRICKRQGWTIAFCINNINETRIDVPTGWCILAAAGEIVGAGGKYKPFLKLNSSVTKLENTLQNDLAEIRAMKYDVEFTETPLTAATKFISAAERMDSIYKLLWLAKPENDPEIEIRMENLIKASIDYSYYRSRWLGISPIEQNNTEHDRTISHNILIEAKDALSEYMLDHGMNISWAIKLGDERKMIGDFGCYLSYVQAIKAR